MNKGILVFYNHHTSEYTVVCDKLFAEEKKEGIEDVIVKVNEQECNKISESLKECLKVIEKIKSALPICIEKTDSKVTVYKRLFSEYTCLGNEIFFKRLKSLDLIQRSIIDLEERAIIDDFRKLNYLWLDVGDDFIDSDICVIEEKIRKQFNSK